MIRVVLADDQPLVRTGLKMILSSEPDIDVVGEAPNGEAAVALCAERAPDVVLMDVRMPVMDGIAATKAITAAEHPPRVLVLTTFDLDEVVYDALRAGASGFLLKDAPEERLTTAIRVVAEGGSLFAQRHPPAHRGVRPQAAIPCRLAGQAHRARDRGPAADRPGTEQHGDLPRAVRLREHRQDSRGPRPDEARAARPSPGRRARLRVRTGQGGDRRAVISEHAVL